MSGRFVSKPGWALGVFIIPDTLCVGFGMGVPIFCLLLGFPAGWQLAKIATSHSVPIQGTLAPEPT